MKGTLPAWKRPVWKTYWLAGPGIEQIDLSKVLRDYGFAAGVREAAQLPVWISWPQRGTDWQELYECRMGPLSREMRRIEVEPGCVIFVGKTERDALCHRIVFAYALDRAS